MAEASSVALSGDLYEPDAPSRRAPLIVAHGLFGSASNWRTAARRFGTSRPTLAVDMRNHGDSPWADAMDYRAMGADLLAAIDARFGRPAILLGHSMGGKAAMAAALTAPEKVRALVVVDIAPVVYEHPEHAEIARAMLGVDLSAITRRSEADDALKAAAPDPAMRAFLLQNLAFDGDAAGAPPRRARWRPNVRAIEKSVADALDWPAALQRISYAGPTLSIRGGASKYVSEAGLAALRRQFPALEAAAIPGAGHWPHAEDPEAFLALAESFLAKLD